MTLPPSTQAWRTRNVVAVVSAMPRPVKARAGSDAIVVGTSPAGVQLTKFCVSPTSRASNTAARGEARPVRANRSGRCCRSARRSRRSLPGRLRVVRPQVELSKDRASSVVGALPKIGSVVLRHQELAHRDLAPAALQADEGFATGDEDDAAMPLASNRRLTFDLDLEESHSGRRPGFRCRASRSATSCCSRGDGRCFERHRPARRALTNSRSILHDRTASRCGLRLHGQRQRKCAGDGKSDELFIHGISPLTIRLASGSAVAPAIGTFSGGNEKLTQLCQSGESIGKLKPATPKPPCESCCLIATRKRLLRRRRTSVGPGIIHSTSPCGARRARRAKNGHKQRLAGRLRASRSGYAQAAAMTSLACCPALIAAAVAWDGASLARHAPGVCPSPRRTRARCTCTVPRGGGLAIWAGWLRRHRLAARCHNRGSRRCRAHRRVALGRSPRHYPAIAPGRCTWRQRAGVGRGSDAAQPGHRGAGRRIVWMANLYNFMDGSDGLAGDHGGRRLRRVCAGRSRGGQRRCADLARAGRRDGPVPAVRNFPPARIFLGDVGLGAAGLSRRDLRHRPAGSSGWWPGWFPLLVFLPFIADATVDLDARLLARREGLGSASRAFLPAAGAAAARPRGTLALYAALMIGAACRRSRRWPRRRRPGSLALVWARGPRAGLRRDRSTIGAAKTGGSNESKR